MAGLAFEALDRHVVAGRGEETCIYFSSGSMTFAEFLTDTAALAGGLRRLNGDGPIDVELQLEANSDRLRLLFALLRLGVAPTRSASIVVTGSPALIRLEDEEVDLDALRKIGQVDPEPAPRGGDEHLIEILAEVDRAWYEDLRAGRAITVK